MLHLPCPSICLPMTSGRTFDTASLKGAWFVLYFYPKDNTAGCTQEGDEFRDLYSQFRALGVELFGLSRDSIRSHEKFKAQQAYPFELISDPDKLACTAFDVIRQKKMYGKEVTGIERSTFVIDPDGIVVQQWRGVKVPGHAQTVLTFLLSKMSLGNS